MKSPYQLISIIVFTHALASSIHAAASTVEVKQVLIDGVNSVDGLDNPRQVKLSPDDKYAFVTSADDDSLLILELNGLLNPIQLYKSADTSEHKLVGASSLVVFNQGKKIAITSFYDSALSLFDREIDSRFTPTSLFTDNISYERIFKSNEPLNSEDTYGLLGAWGIAVDSKEKQIFVASYKSNAISIFDVNKRYQLSFNSKLTFPKSSSNNLGSPVSLAYSALNNDLVVAGYESNTLSVLSKDKFGNFYSKQIIKNDTHGIKHLVNPQQVLLSPDNQYLYVACSGSNTVFVFKSTNNQYIYIQSITHSETAGSGLAGVGSLAITPDGSRLFAAGEMDKGLLFFDIMENGTLQFVQKFSPSENPIEGVTSITTTSDGQYLLLTLGKKDALYLLKI